MSKRSQLTAALAAGGTVVVTLTGCGAGSINYHPDGARSSRAAVVGFLRALERRDSDGMRRLMAPAAQRNEELAHGLFSSTPKLTTFHLVGRARGEDPRTNASPRGSIASTRYTVALTPSAGFDDEETSGDAYGILVSEGANKHWLVSELGGAG